MAALWNEVMRVRQFAPVRTAQRFADWLKRAPGLSISDYLVAHDGTGRLLGFIGCWDQSTFKRLVVVDYTWRLAAARSALNAIAPLTRSRMLPPPDEPLPLVSLVDACATDAHVLRSLLLAARARCHGRFAFMSLPLDVRDPLLAATRGLFAQPTFVDAYVGTTEGAIPICGAGPIHFESALV
jgi:hypothetical protein